MYFCGIRPSLIFLTRGAGGGGAWCHVCNTRGYTQKISYFHVFFEKDHLSLSVQEKISYFWEKNTIFQIIQEMSYPSSALFEKTIFSERLKKISYFRVFFWERSSFIFRLRGKIIFSRKRNIILPGHTRKIIFHRKFCEKTIFSGRLEKENVVFRAVFL